MQRAQIVKDSVFRPQANFLPQAPKRGTADVISQPPSKRLLKEEEAEEGVQGTVAV